MGKLSILVVCLYSIFPFFISAQSDNVWVFGNEAGIDFNTASPLIFKADSLALSNECSSSICDESGNLIMYSNGTWVRNANNEVMPNGNGILGNTSTTQGALFIPKPGSNHIYYLFTLDNEGGPDGLRYSEIDMNLNEGSGEVTENKNILLMPEVGEQMAYTFHANGIDIWVIVHSSVRDEFYAFLVTAQGISFVPSISQGGTHAEYVIGSMTVSPDGTRLAVAYKGMGTKLLPHGMDIFYFNRSTGVLNASQQVIFNDSDYGGYGIEFSPNGQLLYCSVRNVYSSVLYQFDLEAQDFLNSQTIIEDVVQAKGMKRGPNGKIYIATQGNYLGVIENPNESGEDCNYSELSLISVPGISSKMGLPQTFSSDVVSSVDWIDDDHSINIECYPNPTRDNVMLDFDYPISFRIEVYNSMGQLLLTDSYSNSAQQLIAIPDASGIYILTVEIENERRFSARIIKE